jgi:hypothetical protein
MFAFTNTSSVPHNFAILKSEKLIGTTSTLTGGVRQFVVGNRSPRMHRTSFARNA